MLNLSRERPGTLLAGSVNTRCEVEGCDSKKTWTRKVEDAEGKREHMCIVCLRRLDNNGLLVMAPAHPLRRAAV